MRTIILQGENLNLSKAEELAVTFNGELDWRTHYAVIKTNQVTNQDLHRQREEARFDINLLPDEFDVSEAALLVSDMDSTLITIECIDEIADFMGIKPQVAKITESAMQGEIDFETSLRQRVSLLKGLDVEVLERVYQERLSLSPGAEMMVESLKRKGMKLALVSGGFTFFTERLQQRLGLDYTQANKLAVENGKLTGEIDGQLCGAQTKAEFLHSCCQQLNIKPNQCVAIGDGANDLVMMAEAGLSIAYHAKPTVQTQADTAINHNGLDAIIGLLQLEYNI